MDGRYTLELNCGCRQHDIKATRFGPGVLFAFEDVSRAAAIRQAEADGWLVSWRRKIAVCPTCAAAQRQPK